LVDDRPTGKFAGGALVTLIAGIAGFIATQL